ncbi:MAG: toxin-antitoxin system YwqK family antitoxin [Bacteroidales bacterium]|nr:toxin-antitoxin system YwqK family antitoxin [Bacteroidales bacterium]
MKTIRIVTILIPVLLVAGCNPFKKKTDPNAPEIAYEYYDNGKIKSEVSMVDTFRQGITKNYNRSGQLISEVMYEKDMKHGWAKNFYPSGQVHSKMMYQEDIKNGDEIWYYESGKEYRISPYVNGKREGMQKAFYENGNLKYEVPYKNGNVGTGLKEYSMNGELITDYPVIVIKEINNLARNNKYILRISLSNQAGKVKYYKGELDEGQFLGKTLMPLITEKGVAQYVISVTPGGTAVDKLNFIANYTTPMGNPCILQKKFNLNVRN